MGLKMTKTKVKLENASGSDMKMIGECVLYAQATGGKAKRIWVIISPDLKDKMLLGWKSQKLLGLLHSNWPGVIQEEASAERVNQVTEKEDGPRGASLNKESQKKMKNGKKQQDFPMDGKQNPEILALLHEYSDIFRNEMEDTDRNGRHR